MDAHDGVVTVIDRGNRGPDHLGSPRYRRPESAPACRLNLQVQKEHSFSQTSTALRFGKYQPGSRFKIAFPFTIRVRSSVSVHHRPFIIVRSSSNQRVRSSSEPTRPSIIRTNASVHPCPFIIVRSSSNQRIRSSSEPTLPFIRVRSSSSVHHRTNASDHHQNQRFRSSVSVHHRPFIIEPTHPIIIRTNASVHPCPFIIVRSSSNQRIRSSSEPTLPFIRVRSSVSVHHRPFIIVRSSSNQRVRSSSEPTRPFIIRTNASESSSEPTRLFIERHKRVNPRVGPTRRSGFRPTGSDGNLAACPRFARRANRLGLFACYMRAFNCKGRQVVDSLRAAAHTGRKNLNLGHDQHSSSPR